ANDEIQVSAIGLTYYYALMVNPTIYTSCIKQLWATAKAKTVNEEVHIQALVDGKKVIVTETSVRRALQLKDAKGTECLPNATIFEQLTLMGAKTTAWNEFSSTMASVVICLATNQNFNFSKYIFDNMVKELEVGKQEDNTEVTQPSGPTEPITDEAANAEHVPTHYNDPLFSGEDRLQLKLLELCTKLSEIVLDLENTKTSQAAKITKLKERVKNMERRNKSRTPWLKRLRKVGRSAQVVSSEDEGLGAQEDASKQERKIADLDADVEEVEVEKVVSTAEVTTASATTTTVNELTLAQTLIEIKAAKPKAVKTAATTTTTAVTRPKARGVVWIQMLVKSELQEGKDGKESSSKRAGIRNFESCVLYGSCVVKGGRSCVVKGVLFGSDLGFIGRKCNGRGPCIRRRYSSMIKILQIIDREDLETLWKLVKAKHRNIRPEEAYERVL
ncbi:hypothetical protein Tco_0984444, partial [Tanacetum coccineum]